MISMKYQYFNLNRILLLLIGLWPYQRSKLVQLQLILFFGIITTFIMLQLMTFLTSQCTVDLVLRTLFSAFTSTTVIIVYVSFFNRKSVRTLLEKIQYTYDKLDDNDEIAIIERYWSKAKHYTTGLITFAAFNIFCFISIQLWACILDVILPLNESRSLLQLQIMTKHFEYVDRERYIYLIILHTDVVIIISVLVALGIGTMMIAYNQHICGMFRIASYRIEYAMSMDMLQSISTNKEHLIYRSIVCAVDIHRKAMQYADNFISAFEIWFALLIIIGILSVSLNLFQIFQTLSSGTKNMELPIYLMFLTAQYLFMFLGNYIAQEVADHNKHLFATVYNVRWYIAPLNIQKIILFLLQRGTKPYNLNLGGIFVGSLEGFATLTSTTISYFTVIYSTRR